MKKSGRRFISYADLEEYGAIVVDILLKKGEKAILILSRESTCELFRNYSDFFEERIQNGVKGIYLNDKKSVDDLIDGFRGYISLDLLLAFVDNRSTKVLEIA